MCMPANPAAAQAAADRLGPRNRTAAGFLRMSAATNPSYVRSVYDKEGPQGFERKFGAYDGGPQNPFGGAAYRTLAKQQGREFNKSDLFGEKAAQDKRFSALEQQIADLKKAGIATAATSQQTAPKQPARFTTLADARNYRTAPSPTSMKTLQGVKQFTSLNSSKMGLNTPN
jgi:hypothetical protein